MKKLLTLPFLDGYRDHGLLWLRLALGASFVAHGYPKLAGGSERWEKLGCNTSGSTSATWDLVWQPR